jgi:hypothetical protein
VLYGSPTSVYNLLPQQLFEIIDHIFKSKRKKMVRQRLRKNSYKPFLKLLKSTITS